MSPVQPYSLPAMKKFRIYYNFHKKLFSVQEKVDGSWKVVEHVKDIYLRNVKFKVSEAGRQRVLKEKRKNVHAFMLGERWPFIPASSLRVFDEVSYNPYVGPNFMVKTEHKPLDYAKYVAIVHNRVFALIPEFKGVQF